MSSISLNGASSVLFPQLAATNTDPLLAPDSSAASNALESNLAQSQNTGALPNAGRNHHHKSELFQQVQQAVTNTLKSAQGNSSANANQLIEQAITNLIQQTVSGSSSAASSSADPNDQTAGTTGASSQTNSQSAFFQALQENGINPQQFRNDFLSAIQQAQQTGTANPAAAFSAFPSGLSVDTAA